MNLFESLHLAGELAVDERARKWWKHSKTPEASGRVLHLLNTHARTHTPNELMHHAHPLESGQKDNSKASARSKIKDVGNSWYENAVNKLNAPELLETAAEQMTVTSLCVNRAELS